MNVSKEFANAATKPNVDVYVVANGRSTTTLNESTTREQLEAAVMGESDFGVSTSTLQKGVPTGGLPGATWPRYGCYVWYRRYATYSVRV